MAKPILTDQVSFAIIEADTALILLKSMLVEALNEDDRMQLDNLIDKARAALSRAETILSDAQNSIRDALARL